MSALLGKRNAVKPTVRILHSYILSIINKEQPRNPVHSYFIYHIFSDMECVLCIEKSMKMETLTEEAQKAEKSSEEIKRKLNAANSSLVGIMDVEAKLREDHEHLVLQEAQVRYELEQLRKQYTDQLEERDQAHADRVRALETVLQDKECEWANKNEALRRDLRQAIRSSMADTEREVESLGNLEQVQNYFTLGLDNLVSNPY